MAIIDFQCEDCGEKFFEIVNSSNRDKAKCSKCGSKNIKQVFEGKCCSTASKTGRSCSGSCGSCSGC